MGTILLNQGDFAAAAEEFRKALAIVPGFQPARINLAHALLRAGRTEEAGAELRTVLEQDAANPKALALLGGIELQRGRADEALRMARRAVERDPRSAAGWHALGRVHDAARRLDEARDAYVKASELEPDNPEPLNALGNLHERAGLYEDAAAWYEKALEVDPTYAPGYNNLALQYQRLGRRDDALRVYERGRERLPNSSILLNNLATWHHQAAQAALEAARVAPPAEAGRLRAEGESAAARAELLYAEAIEASPLDPSPVNNLGGLMRLLGRGPEALAKYEAAARLDPAYADARHNIGLWHLEAGDWTRAHDAFAEVLAIDPDYVESLRLDAVALLRLGRPNDALEQLEGALGRMPGHPRLLAALGAVHDDLGDVEQACRRYREALAASPSADVAARVGQLCGGG